MQINAVFDGEGRILAASPSGGDYDGPRPVPAEGQQAATLDVTEDLDGAALADLCLRSRVDLATRALVVEDAAGG